MIKNVLVINGPNLNMLGKRPKEHYGAMTLDEINELIKEEAKDSFDVSFYQSNYEGDIITKIQDAIGVYDAIVINPGAYTHTSIAILDALKAVNIKYIEVHISKVDERESFRQISYIRENAVATIIGHGLDGYIEALDYLKDLIKNEN